MTTIAMTIAGLDPSGGAGVIADVKTFSAFGCFASAVVTSVTYQNTQGVFGASHQTAESVREQILPIIDDYQISAVKTGMMPTAEIIEEVAGLLRETKLVNIVVDPVVRSTSGFDLIDDLALRSLMATMFPIADLITPNIPEVERITGIAIESEMDIRDAADVMRSMGARNILIKGGHLPVGAVRMSDADVGRPVRTARDLLIIGDQMIAFDAEFYETTATHGTGCTLSAAIAANLALGESMIDAVRISKDFVNAAIRTAPMIGKGHSPINIRPI